MKVCSLHFKNDDFFFGGAHINKINRLRKTAVPSQNLPVCSHDCILSPTQMQWHLDRVQRLQNRAKNKSVQKAVKHVEELPDLTAGGSVMITPVEIKKTYEDKGVQVNTYDDFTSYNIENLMDSDYNSSDEETEEISKICGFGEKIVPAMSTNQFKIHFRLNVDVFETAAKTAFNRQKTYHAYPLATYLMVPYKDNGNLTPREKNFNLILSKSRAVIENAYALLKGRFRRLKYIETVRMEFIVLLVMSATILHNLCILCDDKVEELFSMEKEILEERETAPVVNACEEIRNRGNAAAIQKRRDIENSLPLII
ncbi:hypothetical protein ILUMI_25559 [Ignelater luminosus]|uniref:DDE Tnp4 domain-containing protein n=1 Tax=Ignelater luminosus TaxID=2038154 RepID=A0A8K0FZY1_IGNLU|nr:hypothetical protein ILUMI_25559 [Ignelater luminosus]